MVDVNEKHYSVDEIAKAWNVSADLVREVFLPEPGVLNFGKPKRHRRVYRMIRVPQRVLDRVYLRLTSQSKR